VEGRVTKEAVMARSTAVLVRYDDRDVLTERSVVAGFLAGYTGSTRVSYSTDLRLFAAWCTGNGSSYFKPSVLIWSCSPGRWSPRV
jgi:hypothetical protein